MRVDAAVLGLVLSAVGTLVVIVGAIAAVRQLQHLRRANELTAISKFVEEWSSATFEADRAFVQRELPAVLRRTQSYAEFRDDPRLTQVFKVAHFFERLAFLTERGALSEELAMFLFGSAAISMWEALRPFVVELRTFYGMNTPMEYFEDFAMRAPEWSRRNEARTKRLRRDPQAMTKQATQQDSGV